MKAAILTNNGFQIDEQPIPTPGPGELLVKNIATGICEGDVFVYRSRTAEFPPTLLGHESTGIVEAIGTGVTGFTPGDKITAIGGAYADYFTAPTTTLVKLPDSINPLHALGEPIACCIHAANRFGIRLGDRVTVLGCGFMGLICLQLANRQGASFICALDPIKERRDMACQLGADVALNPIDQQPQDILGTYGEFDVVIEAAGVTNTVDMSGDLVKQHGRIIIVGYHQSHQGIRHINMKQWNFKAIDVINGHVRRHDEKQAAMAAGMALLANGRLKHRPPRHILPPHRRRHRLPASHQPQTRPLQSHPPHQLIASQLHQ